VKKLIAVIAGINNQASAHLFSDCSGTGCAWPSWRSRGPVIASPPKCNDGDHYQKFDQGEAAKGFSLVFHHFEKLNRFMLCFRKRAPGNFILPDWAAVLAAQLAVVDELALAIKSLVVFQGNVRQRA